MLDVGRAHYREEIRRRAPWMLLSVAAGAVMVKVGSSYEQALSERVELAFFVPMIVYMSDSIGTETLALFVRALALEEVRLRDLILKESLVGATLGILTGVPMAAISYLWLGDLGIAMVVAAAMTINGVVAVLVGMLVPILFSRLRRDPAVGSDEITTAVSDNVSMLVYFVTATLMLSAT